MIIYSIAIPPKYYLKITGYRNGGWITYGEDEPKYYLKITGYRNQELVVLH